MTDPMRLKVRVGAPRSRVWRALTDPAELRVWLAEYAEVAEPDTYRFWGPAVPAGDLPRQRLLHTGADHLRFEWTVEGTATVVDIGLDAEGDDSTILRLSQTNLPPWSVPVAETSLLSVLHTFWALSIANLVDHTEGRIMGPRCDFTSARMRAEYLIHAGRAAVYESIMDPDTFAQWFGAKVDVEPRAGGRWAMGGFDLNPTPATIVDLEPGERVAIGFRGGVVATWELEDSDGATRLTFVQSGFDETHPPYDGWMGWLGGIAELRRFHELDQWRLSWLEVDVPGTPEGIITIKEASS